MRALYPGGGGLEPLRPDLLAERHAVDQLAASGEFTRACFAGLEERQAVRALTVLARACAHHDQAPALIEGVLRGDVAGLAGAAIVVAVQTGTRMGALLAGVLTDVPARLEDLQRIAGAIPYPTVALAAADATVTQRVCDLLPADADPADLAEWSRALATALHQIGRPRQALEASTDAVRILRELAEVNPDRYRPDLAQSLTNLGADFSALGRVAEALPVTEEAVRIRRELAEVNPDRYRPDLARSWAVMGMALLNLDQVSESIRCLVEGLAIAVERDLSDLANGIANLLQQAYERDHAAFVSAWRQLTGEDLPSWLQQPGG